MQSYFKFIEYGYGNTYEVIFPLKPNYQAYRILTRYFGELSDSSYFVYKFEITTDKTDEIDIKKIYGVGKHRLALYQRKIKEHCKEIAYAPICYKWNINRSYL